MKLLLPMNPRQKQACHFFYWLPCAVIITLVGHNISHGQSIKALFELSSQEYRAGNYREALAINQKLIKLSPEIPDFYINAALYHQELAEWDQAAQYFEKALLQSKDVEILINLASFYTAIGKFCTAEQLLLEVFDQASSRCGSSVLDQWNSPVYENYARLIQQANGYAFLGDIERARRRTIQAYQRRCESCAANHPFYALIQEKLGEVYMYMERYDEAESLLLGALQIRDRSKSIEWFSYQRCLRLLGQLFTTIGLKNKANLMFERSEKMFRDHSSTGHPDLGILQIQKARLYHQQGKDSLARKAVTAGLAIISSRLGQKHPWYTLGLVIKGLTAVNKREAGTLYKQAAQLIVTNFPDPNIWTLQVLNTLTTFYLDQQELDIAEEKLHQAQTILADADIGANSRADVAINEALLLLSRNKAQDALTVFTQADSLKAVISSSWGKVFSFSDYEELQPQLFKHSDYLIGSFWYNYKKFPKKTGELYQHLINIKCSQLDNYILHQAINVLTPLYEPVLTGV